MSQRPGASALSGVVTVLVSGFLALAAAEVTLRMEGWGVDAAPEHAHLLRYDSTIGWTKAPNVSVNYRFAGHRIHESSNSFGGRGREIKTEGESGPRVLFLGDSFCEGYLVARRHVFSAVLEQLDPDVQAINLGVAGYSTDQEYLLYQRNGRAAESSARRAAVLRQRRVVQLGDAGVSREEAGV